MKILGIETAVMSGGVALLESNGDDVRLIAHYLLGLRESYEARLLPMIDAILRQTGTGIDSLGLIAVDVGPGSFTGLRIGLATAKGLAQPSRKPVIGVSALDALAHNLRRMNVRVCAALDALRGEVYYAIYEGGKRISEYRIGRIEEIEREFRDGTIFIGNGLSGSLILDIPNAVTIAELGFEGYRRRGPDDLMMLSPLYVRRPEAEVRWRDMPGP
ncbi:MAG: tRNA (adenosine(37)-N6)-threonylcarbamoyltransferase complex dimerization subunit type 1 TsaB [bacterium]